MKTNFNKNNIELNRAIFELETHFNNNKYENNTLNWKQLEKRFFKISNSAIKEYYLRMEKIPVDDIDIFFNHEVSSENKKNKFVEIHNAWEKTHGIKHPLYPLIEDIKNNFYISKEIKQIAILPRSLIGCRVIEAADIKSALNKNEEEMFPQNEVTKTPVPDLPLIITNPDKIVIPKRAAPIPLRLVWGLTSLVRPEDRNTRAVMRTTLDELGKLLYKPGTKFSSGRNNIKENLRRNLIYLGLIHYQYGNSIFVPFSVSEYPSSFDSKNNNVFINVNLTFSKDSDHGPYVNRDKLLHYGLTSNAQWKTYIKLNYMWDTAKMLNNGCRVYSTRKKVLRDKNGYIVDSNGNQIKNYGTPTKNWNHKKAIIIGVERNENAIKRVPLLTDDDLIYLVFDKIPEDPKTKWTFLQRAKKTLKTMEKNNDIEIIEYSNGWKILETWEDNKCYQ